MSLSDLGIPVKMGEYEAKKEYDDDKSDHSDKDDESDEEGDIAQDQDSDLKQMRISHILKIKDLYDLTIKMLRDRSSTSYGVDLHPASTLNETMPPHSTVEEVAKRFEELIVYNANPTIASSVQHAFGRDIIPLRIMMSQIIPRGPVGEKLMLLFAERGTDRNAKTSKNVSKKQVSTKLINAFLSAIAIAISQGENIKEVIIVSPVPIPIERSGFSMIVAQQSFFLQIFTDGEIYTPVSESIIASKYRIFAGREAKDYIQSQGLEGREANLPQLNHNDPALKYLGARPGQIVEIIRPPIHAMSSVQGGMSIKKIVAGATL